MAIGAPKCACGGKPTQLLNGLEATNAEVKAEGRSLRSEFQRLRAIETGVDAERNPVEHPWLH
jgi:hypothetical protein